LDDSAVERRSQLGGTILAASEALCRQSVDAQYAAEPGLMTRFGPAGYQKSLGGWG
jgi:hypothetical protein